MHRRLGWWVTVLFLGAAAVAADAPKPAESADKIVEESWESASLDGVKVGSVHTTVTAVQGDVKRLRATVALELSFQRHNATMRLRMAQGDEETADGAVVGVFMKQSQESRGGVTPPLQLSGTLEDGRMHVQIDGGRVDRRLRWGADVVGVYRLEHFFQEHKPKPGDHYSFPFYQPTLNAVVPMQVLVKDREEAPSAGDPKGGAGDKGGETPPLLRVELRPDRIEGSGLSVQLPAEVWWLDADFVPVRRQMELEGLGAILRTRTTQDAATVAGAGRLPDLNQKNLIPLNRTIPHPHATRAAVYRIALHDDPAPETAFARDGHQDVVNVQGSAFELHVHPVRLTPSQTLSPKAGEGREGDAAPAPAEYLESCRYIDCDDARVKELARTAVGAESDPWNKARRIERWVKQNMRPDDGAALAPAGEVARTLRGDCRHYALLTAALCRAAGVPARTAVGLIYVEKASKPYFGFHMWTEVYVNGQWLGLDGTLGLGGVGAAHLKVADHSWRDVESLTPLLPVSRILGKTTITVVSVEAGE